jgi:uncharacterized protein with von Willebrand factor type A (vWA) domain
VFRIEGNPVRPSRQKTVNLVFVVVVRASLPQSQVQVVVSHIASEYLAIVRNTPVDQAEMDKIACRQVREEVMESAAQKRQEDQEQGEEVRKLVAAEGQSPPVWEEPFL